MIRQILEAVDSQKFDLWSNNLRPILVALKNKGWQVVSRVRDPEATVPRSHEPEIYTLEGPYEGMKIELYVSPGVSDGKPWVFRAFIHLDPGATDSALEIAADDAPFQWYNQSGVIQIQNASAGGILNNIESLDKMYGLRFKGKR